MQSIAAEVRYLNEEWRTRNDTPSIGSRETRRANTSKKQVRISDARDESLDLSLDVEGFELVDHQPNVIDFYNVDEVKARYYPEIEGVVRRALKSQCKHVFFTQHVVRTEDTTDFNKAYARFLHCDYSLNNARIDANQIIRGAGVEPKEFEQCDFVWFNSWQPIEWEAELNPLAVIDASSLSSDDIVDYYYDGFGKASLSSMPVFNPGHRLYYFPRMQTSEVLLIKQLDTRDGVASACPHTSFENREASPMAHPRRSIEVRMMCAVV